jgi:hypothetical protein
MYRQKCNASISERISNLFFMRLEDSGCVGATDPTTHCHIAEHLNPRLRRCKNLKSGMTYFVKVAGLLTSLILQLEVDVVGTALKGSFRNADVAGCCGSRGRSYVD